MKTKHKELIISSLEELEHAAEQLLTWAGARKKMIFKGEIGAGKTTFIQVICQKLGSPDPVTSPSFSLINEYTYFDEELNREALIHHIDLYRLNNLDEALNIGIEDYLFDENYCFIEWPEIVEPLLPVDIVEINLHIVSKTSRKFLFL